MPSGFRHDLAMHSAQEALKDAELQRARREQELLNLVSSRMPSPPRLPPPRPSSVGRIRRGSTPPASRPMTPRSGVLGRPMSRLPTSPSYRRSKTPSRSMPAAHSSLHTSVPVAPSAPKHLSPPRVQSLAVAQVSPLSVPPTPPEAAPVKSLLVSPPVAEVPSVQPQPLLQPVPQHISPVRSTFKAIPLAVTVEGAGRAEVNGVYLRVAPGVHESVEAAFKNGPNLLYLKAGRWRLNNEMDTTGWIYSAPSLIGMWCEGGGGDLVNGGAYPLVTESREAHAQTVQAKVMENAKRKVDPDRTKHWLQWDGGAYQKDPERPTYTFHMVFVLLLLSLLAGWSLHSVAHATTNAPAPAYPTCRTASPRDASRMNTPTCLQDSSTETAKPDEADDPEDEDEDEKMAET
eukprot:TRINITY_DN21319_c0_g1_i1.p1 TRINITY_DN21319_c0_g1~~TRINITY_DN21319_c0_g1_i1.p1  ORF type:complete len:403 (+),score=97.95 TRINITY_DN21319_c0_g1_i1:44-1252(+)